MIPKEAHAENEGTPITLENGNVLRPISAGEARQRLQKSFAGIENAAGSHAVLDTEWSHFLDVNFKGLVDVRQLLDTIYQRDGDISVLDEGCGSSLTLFQAVEDIEKHKKDGGKIQACGLTASPDYLFKGVPPVFRDEILRSSKATGIELRREELLLNGVQNSEQDGYYRESPAGHMMRFLKADAHFLSEALPDNRFDLIYSSSAYPHFSAPWLAFEQACNALREGGVAMIDSLPTTDIVDINGKPLSPEQYQDVLQRQNPAYRVHFKSSSNPFYSPMVVERTGNEDFDTGLYLASVTDSKVGIPQRHFANVYTEGKLPGYTPLSEIKSK